MQTNSELHVSPFYHEAKNQIVQPGHFVACSRYFVERWMSRLGGTAVALVLYLRSLGYYNPLTGECRDGVQVSLKQIAAACGCSERTIQRELEKNEALREFVRVEACYQQGPQGNVQRLENAYRIAMDDPIVPEDAPLLQQLIAQREEHLKSASKSSPAEASAVRDARQPARLPVREAKERTPPRSRGMLSIGDKLTPPSRQIGATLPTDCHLPGVNLTGQESIPNHIQKTNNNIPSEIASKTDVVAFLSETGVRINETITATISRDVAKVLAREPAIEETAKRQAAYLPFRTLSKGGTWGGLWRKSIEGDWPAPDAYREHERKERERAQRQATRGQVPSAEQEASPQEREWAERLQTVWEALGTVEQTRLREEAVNRLPTSFRQRYRECREKERPLPQMLHDMLTELCDVLLRERCQGPPRSTKSLPAPVFFGWAEIRPDGQMTHNSVYGPLRASRSQIPGNGATGSG